MTKLARPLLKRVSVMGEKKIGRMLQIEEDERGIIINAMCGY